MFQKYVLNSFLESANTHSSRNAFCIDDKFFTYEQFSQTVSKIRSSLQKIIKFNKNIGLATNDDLETYASIFAIWLEGCAYVPIHPKQAVERSKEIISQCDIEIILDSSTNSIFEDQQIIQTSNLKFETLNLEPKPTSEEDLAYILFTSGSTGKPKGVPITRKNLGTFMHSFWKTGVYIDVEDRCLQSFDLTFDISVQCYLVPLAKGACVFTIPEDQIKFQYAYNLMEDHQLTFAAMAPSMIQFLRPYFDEISLPSLKYNLLVAEASNVKLIEEWSKCIPNAEIINFYGPTEATIYCAFYKFVRDGKNKQLNGMLSIGKAMPDLTATIIDENENLLNKDEQGELCFAGDQLTPGYCKDEEKNKNAFFEKEIEGKLTRFYKTGDSCYFDEENELILGGRLDHQVKIQGYRIELGEVEHHVRKFIKGKNTVAISRENAVGNAEIVVVIEGEAFDISKLKEGLKSKMPDYMLPSKIIFLQNFPLTTSSKIDRIKLKTLL